MAFNMNQRIMNMPQQPPTAPSRNEQSSPNLEMSALRRSTFDHMDALQPKPVVSPDLSHFNRNNAGVLQESASTLNPSHDLGPNVTTAQEPNLEASDFDFNGSTDGGLRNIISGHGTENAPATIVDGIHYQPGGDTEPLNADICLAELGVNCYCEACSGRANLNSTAPARFDIEPNNYHTSAHVRSQLPGTTLGDSRPFGAGNANSYGCTDFVQNALSAPYIPTQDFAQNYLGPGGRSNRVHSAISPFNVNNLSVNNQDQERFRRAQLGQEFFGHPEISYSTQSWNPSSSLSAGHLNYYRGYQQFPDNGPNHPSSSSLQSMSYNEMIGQSHQEVPRQRNNRKSLKSNGSCSQASRKQSQTAWPEYKQFLKAQKHLDLCLEAATGLSNEEKEGLSKFLDLSASQLESVIQARNTIEPILNNLASVCLNLGLPANHVAGWFLQMPPPKLSNIVTDSAYESNLSSSPEEIRIAKRQKRSGGAEIPFKPFQCTFTNTNKSYCLQAFKDYNDWKRHEETHYPQKRWVCLIQGSAQDISCHVCSDKISSLNKPATRNHVPCLQEECRAGHFFPRKDKLLAHIKADHGFSGPTSTIESWYQSLSVDWKRQCGFCGDQFSEWEKRCRHVEQHFLRGKKTVPDWKDPWLDDTENSDFRPDNDEDKGGDGMGDGHADPGDEPGNDDVPPEDNSGGNSREHDREHDQQRDGAEDTQEPSSQHGSKRSRSRRTRGSSHQDNNQQTSIAAGSVFSGQGCQESTEPSSEQRLEGVFRSVRQLGYGAFGVVEEIVHSRSSKHFARKTIRTAHRESSIALSKVRKEVAALRQLTHGHIIKVLASYRTQAQFSIIMSPVADCNLSEFMRDANPQLAIRRLHLSKWFGCLASALSYVHEKSWLHLDLKPQNILVSGDRIFLSDFGSAWPMDSSLGSKGSEIRFDVTPMYCAPELVGRAASRAATSASDIYSLGCIYLEMATILYRESINTFEDFRSSGRGDRSFYANTSKCGRWIERLWEISENAGLNVPKEDLLVIGSMLSLDAGLRPSASNLEKLYLREYDGDQGTPDKEDNYIVGTDSKAFDPVALASKWLKTCVRNHTLCSSPVMRFFPTRILNVGAKGEDIRLQSKLREYTRPYVTLSHCWGKDNILMTTSKTLKDRSLGIKSSSLPEVFRRAVQLTQALGFSYLWIDSLCIVQDSPEEWAEETSKMAEIYSNSYLTISIMNEDEFSSTSIQSSSVKKLGEEDSKSLCATCVRNCRAFKPLVEDNASTMLLDSPVSKRAWIFQEYVLSSRVLYYSSTRVAWECRSNTIRFDATSKIRNCMSAVKRSLLSYVSNVRYLWSNTAQPQQAPGIQKLWRDIVREYSKRQLTKSSDKLPALAGLAATISATNSCQYLAGLWNDDLKHWLLWSRDDSGPPTVRPDYRAPSWSWAAIDSQVKWPKSVLELPDDMKTSILSCSITLCSKVSPFGGVSAGYIKIKGPMRKAAVLYPYSEVLFEAKDLMPFAVGQWDALDYPIKRTHKWNDPGCQNRELWCLRVLMGVGLMLKESWPYQEGRFERVGVYWMQADGEQEESLGKSWEQCTVTIV